MWNTRHLGLQAVAAMIAAAFVAPSALARHDFEADIESLSSKLYAAPGHWNLQVKYDVEIEGAYPGDAFDLILHVTEHGRPVFDDAGRPLQVVVPLTHPSEFDDGELTFERTAIIPLAYGSIYSPEDVRVRGVVLSRTTGYQLEATSDSVSYHGPSYSYGRYYYFHRPRTFDFDVVWHSD